MRKSFMVLALAAMVGLVGCGEVPPSAREQETRAVQTNQNALIQSTKLPKLTQSLERKNLAERLERINKQNMSGCVYLLGNDGNFIAHFPVRGKVSSMRSYLTPGDQIHKSPNGNVTHESPDLDGAYGENVEGIFFFTSDTNSFVEWNGKYIFTDNCLQISQKPILVRKVD